MNFLLHNNEFKHSAILKNVKLYFINQSILNMHHNIFTFYIFFINYKCRQLLYILKKGFKHVLI